MNLNKIRILTRYISMEKLCIHSYLHTNVVSTNNKRADLIIKLNNLITKNISKMEFNQFRVFAKNFESEDYQWICPFNPEVEEFIKNNNYYLTKQYGMTKVQRKNHPHTRNSFLHILKKDSTSLYTTLDYTRLKDELQLKYLQTYISLDIISHQFSSNFYKIKLNDIERQSLIFRIEQFDCYLTTACVEYKGLADNCDELETLRELRTWMLTNSKGKSLVEEYKKRAPMLVKKIKQSPNKELLLEYCYENVLTAVNLVKQNELSAAMNHYKKTSLELEKMVK